MELYLAKVYPERIMIMGRWASSVFLRYIRIQVSEISKGISTLMDSGILHLADKVSPTFRTKENVVKKMPQ